MPNPKTSSNPVLFEKMLSKSVLADCLGLSLSTLRRRLKEAEYEVPRGLINPAEQEKICHTLGFDHLTRKDTKQPHDDAT